MAYHLSVFLENQPGKLQKVTKVLADNNINLRAMSLANSGEFGIVKLLTDNPEKAFDALKAQKITVTKREIAAVVVDNCPGAFNALLDKLSANGINILDCYGFLLSDGKTAAIVLEIYNYPDAEKTLKNIGVNTLKEQEIYNHF
jgi:hypothetical protein